MSITITDVAELQAISEDLAGDYILGNNIDASETSTWNEDPENPGTYFGFDPLGDGIIPFTGTFDGKGYVISNLYINRPTENNVALFRAAFLGTFKNVGLTNVDITGKDYVAALIGIIIADI